MGVRKLKQLEKLEQFYFGVYVQKDSSPSSPPGFPATIVQMHTPKQEVYRSIFKRMSKILKIATPVKQPT